MSTTHPDYFGPELNDGKHIFVFGSNLNGWHGKGAALTARVEWGAQQGVSMGRTGQAYAIPTKGMGRPMPVLSLDQIAEHVGEFTVYAAKHLEFCFLVTEIGCGLADYIPEQIARMFRHVPYNCILSSRFKDLILTEEKSPRMRRDIRQ